MTRVLARAAALAALLAAAAAPPAAAQRVTGADDAAALASFAVRGLEDAEGVTPVGDVNGDGRTDVAVYGLDADTVRIVLGGDEVPGLRRFDIAGVSVEDLQAPAGVGDLNGDGLGDLVLPGGGDGEFRFDEEGPEGEAYVVFGRRAPEDLDLRRPEQRDATLRTRTTDPVVTSAGDVNGDGRGDLLIAGDTSSAFEGRSDRGRGTVLFGGPELRGEVDTRKPGARGQTLLAPRGEGVYVGAAASDVDGDGLGDLVVGSPVATSDAFDGSSIEETLVEAFRGSAYVVYGRRQAGVVDLTAAGTTRLTTRRSGFLGLSVSGAGDVNGDGLADVAVGAPGTDLDGVGEELGRGTAYVVLGDRSRPASLSVDALGARGTVLEGLRPRAAAGVGLASAGDLDGDGLGDLLVGAPGLTETDDDAGEPGATHVVYGSRTTAASVPLSGSSDRVFTLRGTGTEGLGISQAAGTDLDGDGRRELLVARPGACRVGRLAEGDVLGIELGGPRPAPVAGLGGAGGDRLTGGPSGETLSGLGGADELLGRDGHDCLSGGDGGDVVRGGLSGDALFGEDGDDRVFGDSGCDRIFGGIGADVIVSGPARVALAEALRSPIGARDRDVVRAGEGADRVSGGQDRDRLAGEAGDDVLEGGAADDRLEGGSGRDRVDGAAGRDDARGGPGDDMVLGGAGADQLQGDGSSSYDDDIAEIAATPVDGDDRVSGGAGDDSLSGEGGRDTLLGGPGDDYVDGSFSDDDDFGDFVSELRSRRGVAIRSSGRGVLTLRARAAAALRGVPSERRGIPDTDVLRGGTGDDVLVDSGPGTDRLDGGSGDDRIIARGGGRDVVRCGAGRDTAIVDRTDRVSGCERVRRTRSRSRR